MHCRPTTIALCHTSIDYMLHLIHFSSGDNKHGTFHIALIGESILSNNGKFLIIVISYYCALTASNVHMAEKKTIKIPNRWRNLFASNENVYIMP